MTNTPEPRHDPHVISFLAHERRLLSYKVPMSRRKKRALRRGPKATAAFIQRAAACNRIMDLAIGITETADKSFRERWIFERVLGTEAGYAALHAFLFDVTSLPRRVEVWCQKITGDHTFRKEVLAAARTR